MNICRLKPEFVEPLALALFEEWHDFCAVVVYGQKSVHITRSASMGITCRWRLRLWITKGGVMGSAALKAV